MQQFEPNGGIARGGALSEKEIRKACVFVLLAENAGSFVSYDEIAKTLFVSRSTVVKDVRELKSELSSDKGWTISIVGTPRKGLSLNGSEFEIRRYILSAGYDCWAERHPKNSRAGEDAYTVYLLGELAREFSLDERKKKLLHNAIVLSCTRILSGKTLQELPPLYSNYFEDCRFVQELKLHLEKVAGLTLGKTELDFICFPLNLGTRRCGGNASSRVNEMLDAMVDDVSDAYQFYFDRKFLSAEMGDHLAFMVNRAVFGIKPTFTMDETLERSYPFAFQAARDVIGRLSSEVKFAIAHEEVACLALYLQMAIERHYGSQRKFALVGMEGEAARSLVRNRVRMTFSQECLFVTASEKDAAELAPDSFSAIIAPGPLSVETRVPVIFASELFDERLVTSSVGNGERLALIQNERVRYMACVAEKDVLPNFEDVLDALLVRAEIVGEADESFSGRVKAVDPNRYSYGHSYLPHALIFGGNEYLLDVVVYLCGDEYLAVALLGIPERVDDESEAIVVRLYDFVFDLFYKLSLGARNPSEIKGMLLNGGVR